MKKIYVSVVVCLFFSVSLWAQTSYYWVGGASGNWNNAANWSTTSGGPQGAGVPDGLTENAVFDLNNDADVTLDISPNINSLTITGTKTVKLSASVGGPRAISVNSTSTNPLTPALLIGTGSVLIDSALTGASDFAFTIKTNAHAEINGTWRFAGASATDLAYLDVAVGASTQVNVNANGTIVVAPSGFSPLADNDDLLFFHAGSSLQLMNNGSIIPQGNYDLGSIIYVTGLTTEGLISEEFGGVGNLIYNCPGQANDISLGLPNNFHITGNLNVLNTNGHKLTLIGNEASLATLQVYADNELNVQGNSAVVVASAQDDATTYELFVGSSLVLNGLSFDLQDNPTNIADIDPTNLYVKGNIQHTNGTFGVTSTSTSDAVSYYNLVLNGTSAQTISSSSGTLLDANNQLTLKPNNPSGPGITLLSDFTVGRLDFNTTSGGVINTGSNVLTISNPTPASSSSIVVHLNLSNVNLGYVNGTVRRPTASTDSCELPTGVAGYKGVAVVPVDATPSVYQAKYFNTGNGSTTFVSPLKGIEQNYYWEVNKISGADAAVEVTVRSGISGATGADALVVAKYSGGHWISAYGPGATAITPGDATSGVVLSAPQSSFSPFTLGYGLLAALPIDLVSFTAKKVSDGSAQLNWKISDNSTPAAFEVTKSSDGVHFTSIGSVAGVEGMLEYGFTDNALETGNNYYRLKMFDKDGSAKFSNIVVVINGVHGLVISPMMPTIVHDRGRLNISASSKGNMQLVITDISGRIVQTQTVSIISGSQDVWVNASRLATGMFHVTGYMNGEKTATIRFIKQ